MDRRVIVAFVLGALAYYVYASKVKGVIAGNPIMPVAAGRAQG
jgi:hypothetical protein